MTLVTIEQSEKCKRAACQMLFYLSCDLTEEVSESLEDGASARI